MTEDQENLKRAYQDIKAPAHLATRIRAEVAARDSRRFSWKPIGAVGMTAVAAIWLLPMMWQLQSHDAPPARTPSLTTLAALAPKRPAVGTPSLSQLRSVTTPRMPAKPPSKNLKPQSNLDSETNILEDKDYALI